ncbi:MAG: RNase adapter RapZ [Gammaproteobacteria bacterium]
MIDQRAKRLIILTGMSGSGKSVVIHALEDLGFYCIDNLPVNLLPEFANQIRKDGGETYSRVAIGIDARNPTEDLNHFPEVIEELRATGFEIEQVFVSAEDNVLIKRFSETRRRHPLSSDNVSLAEAIKRERRLLEPLLDFSSLNIDTSHTNIHQLREQVRERVARKKAGTLSIHTMSFGFKYGAPPDADFMFDVRCLPNPYWDINLRDFTGRDLQVINYLEKYPVVLETRNELIAFLDSWIPRYEKDDRSYLTIAIGCTGGHHRSVYMVENIAAYFISKDKDVLATHRDMHL